MQIVLVPALMILSLAVNCCTATPERKAQPGGGPPVITNSFAAKEISQGDIWKIYLEAHDPDGDMRQFVCTLDQLGYGPYSSEYVMVKKEHREKMKGYLTWFSGTGGGHRLGGLPRLTLTVYIRDRGGLKSDKVVFPVVLSVGTKQEPPPPPFDAGELDRLAAIPIELKGRHRGD
jgi:hypothetical protein